MRVGSIEGKYWSKIRGRGKKDRYCRERKRAAKTKKKDDLGDTGEGRWGLRSKKKALLKGGGDPSDAPKHIREGSE